MQEFKTRRSSHRINKIVVLSLFLVLQVPIVVLTYYRRKYDKNQDIEVAELKYAIELSELIVRSAKIPLDLVIFYMYMRMIHYFAMMKLARMRANLVRLTISKKVTIASAFMLGVLGLYSLLMQIVYLAILFYYDDRHVNDKILTIAYDIERNIVWPVIDFLINVAILYMLYTLGLRTL